MTDTPDAPDPDALDAALAAAFGGGAGERRAVVRAAMDLADSGRLRADRGHPLTVEDVVANLEDAPDGGPADRWNWWIGALDVAHGGYAAFGVERYASDPGDREDEGGDPVG